VLTQPADFPTKKYESTQMPDTPEPTDILPLTSSFIATHVSTNKVSSAELPGLVQSVYGTLAAIVRGDASPTAPAVSVAESVSADRLVCLEDGLEFRTLKRHLRDAHDLSPEQYRARWALPADYPIIARSYSKVRSKLAKKLGLETGGRRTQPAAVRRGTIKRKPLKRSRT